MTAKQFKELAIDVIENKMSTYDILNLKNRTPEHFKARKIYYTALMLLKSINHYTYRRFTKRELNGMIDAARCVRERKGFGKEAKIYLDLIKERIIKERLVK